MRKYFNMLIRNVALALFAFVIGCKAEINETNDFTNNQKFLIIPTNRKMSIAENRAISWLGENWGSVRPNIKKEFERQAMLHHGSLASLNKYKNDSLLLLLDSDREEWNGVWAVALTGVTNGVQFCYYLEFNFDTIMVSAVSGLAYNYGSAPIKRVKGEGLVGMEVNMQNVVPNSIQKDVEGIFPGLWTTVSITNNNAINECFGLKEDWTEGEIKGNVHLLINTDLSCQLITPYSGVNANFWNGKICGFKSPQYEAVQFVGLIRDTDFLENLKSENIMYVTLVSEQSLLIRRGTRDEIMFRRYFKEAVFDYKDLEVIRKKSCGNALFDL